MHLDNWMFLVLVVVKSGEEWWEQHLYQNVFKESNYYKRGRATAGRGGPSQRQLQGAKGRDAGLQP